ncbi:lipase 1-like [Ostrinia furnacalis]|uniref:lipase 1-like n=1 Tax=Ostrinia furnacalis TaxID=93504 RepID=UPI0010403F7A|nr:lipase 1-like [Ostrinia furnacalis]
MTLGLTPALLLAAIFLCRSILGLNYAPDLPEDARLNFTGLATKYGLPCEEHDVTTEDGYILKLFHIPGDKTRPVLLMHGIIDSADTFMIRGNTSMVMALSTAGYDVWVGNKRGNRYSRKHRTLDPDIDKQFWDFSFHEIALYDLPATIDHILNNTGQPSLSAIGHSQGNTIFYVLGSMRPEYNDKIKILIALAPVCYLHHLQPPSRHVVEAWPFVDELLSLAGTEEVFGEQTLEIHILKTVCTQKGSYEICAKRFLLALAGMDPEELEPEFLPVVMSHYPSGTSRKGGTHLLQQGLKKSFAQMDYGVEKNLVVYNSVSPPSYDLGKVRMRVALIAAANDGMSALADVKLLRARLPNVVEYQVLERSRCNHLDYVWGRRMAKYLLPHVFSLLERFGG